MFKPRYFRSQNLQARVCLKSLALSLLLLGVLGSSKPQVIRSTTYDTPRFLLQFDRPEARIAHKPINTSQIAERSIQTLENAYQQVSELFRVEPKNKVVLRFLTPAEFKRETGAPEWTSAMFFREQITVPLPTDGQLDYHELERALTHEYVHAVVAEISNYHSPAWLDEGVAQIIEGEINPLLGPALRKWLKKNDPLPLDMLYGGFTTLEDYLVPAAYGQSLFASRILLRERGFSGVVKYLELIGQEETQGTAFAQAFVQAFGFSQDEFERELAVALKAWAESEAKDP